LGRGKSFLDIGGNVWKEGKQPGGAVFWIDAPPRGRRREGKWGGVGARTTGGRGARARGESWCVVRSECIIDMLRGERL